MDNLDNTQEFSLEDILSEFRDPEEPQDASAEQTEEMPAEAPAEEMPVPVGTEEVPASDEVIPEEPVEASAEDSAEPEETPQDDTLSFEIAQKEEAEETPVTDDPTLRLDEILSEAPAETESEQPAPAPIPFPNRTKLQELKKKLIAGPEKRFYDLSEVGVGKLQVGIFLNILIVALCVATTTLFTMELVPANRLRFVIFSQVLAMLVSALLGSQQLLDGLSEILKGRFTVNTLLGITFFVCCADAVFCFQELRVPCCSAFALEMTFALLARYHRRSTEMSQMDTLRKAVRLHSVVKEPNFYNNLPGILRGDGAVEDFMDTYQKSPTPEKVQSVYAFISMILCLGIAALAGMRHSPSLAVQILATSLLVAVPASFFISITRPIALLQRRLHLVGSVICGWQGVKKLCGKAAYPLRGTDLFPAGSTKLNGIKYYGSRAPEEVLSYTTSILSAAGSGLVPLFRNMLTSRGGTEHTVTEFVDYGGGGIGGMVEGNAVLLGSLNFMQDMGVEIPQGTMVSQAVYAAVNGELCAVVAIAYAKMRSASAGLVSLCGFRKTVPILISNDFMLTEEFIHGKFGVNTRRMVFPEKEVRAVLSQAAANPESQVLALTTRDDLASTVYTVSGSAALRTACRWGVIIHMIGGILGMLIMLALAYIGSVELLTPTNVLLYQLVWMIPGVLITEWTRAV